jgi:G3E family GTPase
MTQSPRAVSILSGFLGSGKTTLLRRYLRERGGPDIAVVINEYGAVGVDHHLVRMVEERSVLLQGGCVCCSRREDLVGTLRELLDLEQSRELVPIRQVVIETSGLADPVPILFTLATDPVLRHHFVASSVVVTLDGVNAAAQISRQPEVRKQISIADRVVITKPDLVSREQISRCRMQVRQLNPAAGIVVSSLGDRFDVLAPQDRQDHFRRLSVENDSDLPPNPHPEIRSGALIFGAPLDWASFSVWLSMLLQARGPDVLRIKGLLDIGDAGPVVLNVAQHVVHLPEHLPGWPPDERRSYLTFITRGIDPDRIARSIETFQRAGGRTNLWLKVIA